MSGVVADEEALVLVVDDDQRLRSLLARYLAEHGFRVVAAENAAEARASLAVIEPEAMVLDISMPGEDGLALTQSLRAARARVPILLLTARGAPEDRIAGFEAGADDYLPKPFEPRELLLRLRALMRRTSQATAGPPVSVRLGALTFDAARGELSGPAGVVRLTGGEAALLGELARHAGEALSREAIAASLGMDEASERAIDVQVTRLRRKIEPDPREPRFLFTVRGRGYVLKPGT
jgi:two-component system, OmpR family, phosphate regulon response regulator OmpR